MIIYNYFIPLQHQTIKNNITMKKKNLYPTCVLCDTTELPSYSDYLQYCKENEIEPADENSSKFWDWCAETTQMDFDDLLSNLSHSNESNIPVVITGSLGLWNGRPTICPVVCDNVHDAILKCLGNCDDIKVILEYGELNVCAYHHDGRNCFTINKLSKKGRDYIERHGEYTNASLKDYHLAKFKGYIY